MTRVREMPWNPVQNPKPDHKVPQRIAEQAAREAAEEARKKALAALGIYIGSTALPEMSFGRIRATISVEAPCSHAANSSHTQR